MSDVVVFVPYGSRLGFHVNDVAATMANIDYKFPQCVCFQQNPVCYDVDSHPMDSRFDLDGNISPTVTAKLAKGSADGPLVIIENENICD